MLDGAEVFEACRALLRAREQHQLGRHGLLHEQFERFLVDATFEGQVALLTGNFDLGACIIVLESRLIILSLQLVQSIFLRLFLILCLCLVLNHGLLGHSLAQESVGIKLISLLCVARRRLKVQ